MTMRLAASGLMAALAVGAAGARAEDAAPAQEPIAAGPVKPDWDSLKQYQVPDWFRDAKFGIWAHWSAQCVPEQGDWYAKHMYEQGSAHYKYHVENYGHPSKVGFKDICNLWKAEKWDPEKLITLYQRAGAKYFVALANHHCNFDCWDSKHQPWNSVNIGQWHYRRGIRYKTAAQVIPVLVDIVSKNGNLLLNIPVRGDGTIDDEEIAFLQETAKWMDVNGEGIFATRPWTIFGEGKPDLKGGQFNENRGRAYAADDIRFTTKGDAIYAFILGWPDAPVLIRSMAKGSPLVAGEVADVRLLGHEGKLDFERGDEGLAVKMPAEKPCDHVFTLKITGLKTVASADTSALPYVPRPAERAAEPAPRRAPQTVLPAKDGSLDLAADLAEMHGGRIKVESRGNKSNIGFWDDPQDWASWKAKVAAAGTYEVTALVAAAKGEADFVVDVAGQPLAGKAPETGGWGTYKTVPLGKAEIKAPGEIIITVRPRDAKTWKAINLASVTLKPVK